MKRAFCAACNAHFDLVSEVFAADGPHRSVAIVTSALPAVAPTGKISVARSADNREVITVSSARPFPYLMGSFTIFWFAALAAFYVQAVNTPSVLSLVFPMFHVVAGLLVARKVIKDVRGQDRLMLGDDALTIEQRGALGTQTWTVPYASLIAVRAEPESPPFWQQNASWFSSRIPEQRVLLLRSGADPIYVASGLGHQVDAAAWLAARIEHTVRSRSGDPSRS